MPLQHQAACIPDILLHRTLVSNDVIPFPRKRRLRLSIVQHGADLVHEVIAAGAIHLPIVGKNLIFRKNFFYNRSEENTSELQSLMRISYAVFCLKKKKNK